MQSPFRHLKDLGMGIYTLHLDELLSFVHWPLLILPNLKRMKNYVLLHPTKYKKCYKIYNFDNSFYSKILPKSMAARFFCCSEDKGFVMAIEEISLLPAVDELPKKESPFNIEFVSV